MVKRRRSDRGTRGWGAGVLMIVGLLALLCGGTGAAGIAPGMMLTYIPPYGSSDDLRGSVSGVIPAEYAVVVYIYVGGWWVKPTNAAPLTPIAEDGTWQADITTGLYDVYASEVAAFLVPASYSPPLLSGQAGLPEELYTLSAAHVQFVRRAARTVAFSGHTWEVKYLPFPTGPGPNYFSDDPANVWVDDAGRLHLKITHPDENWYAAEVICTDVLRYGTYSITFASPVDTLNKNVVLGFFTWDTFAPEYNYREIDIEISRWGQETDPNAQYVIQPWTVPGNRHRFALYPGTIGSTHRFTWTAGQVNFRSLDGTGALLHSWDFTNPTAIPPAGAGSTRINLWLMNGIPPSDSQEVEVVIQAYSFEPDLPFRAYLPALNR